MVKTAEIILEYQPLIPGPPLPKESLYQQACSNDSTTVNSWKSIWVEQTRANKAYVGSFKDRGIGKLFGLYQNRACILAGAGPSLKGNVAELKNRGSVPLISCLHNFHFLEDAGVKADFYVSLDAGAVVLEEVSESGKLSADEYWERTKDHTLLAYIGSHPDLIKNWKGKIYFFNAPIPDLDVRKQISDIEEFHTMIGSGGNVLGACLYIAKGIFGCQTIAFTGADFCFSYSNKFHGWDSKYDKDLGYCISLTDVYGVRRKTWQSYANFKYWFDYIACQVPGDYYNCTEGGCLGSYPEGNIAAFKYIDLKAFLEICNMNEHLRQACENPEKPDNKMLF